MNPWTSANGSDTQLMQLYKIGQSGGRNPVQESQYQDLLRQAGLPSNATPSSFSSNAGSGGNTSMDPLALAGSLQQMQVQANQPAISTLQGRESSLSDQYKTLLDSVLTAGTVATNTITGATNAELARRGITGDSFLAGQTLGSALLPVTSQIQTAAANVGMGSAQDISDLAKQIASLQAGNVPGAISAAPQFAGLAALPSQIAATQAQGSLYGAQAQAAPFIPINQGGFVFGPSGNAGAGTLINPLLLALKQMGINITG